MQNAQTRNDEEERGYWLVETSSLRRRVSRAVEEAIYDVLGGPAEAGRILKCTRQYAQQVASGGPVRDRIMALRIQEATRERDRIVPASELMEIVPWLGMDVRSPDPKTRRRATILRQQCPRPESNWDLGSGVASSAPSAALTRIEMRGSKTASAA